MTTLKDFDLNELTMQLHSELKFAFDTVAGTQKQAGLNINEVKARIGRKHLADDTGDDNVLNTQRYPSEEDWELEVAYRYGDPVPVPSSHNWLSGANSRWVLDKLGSYEIAYVKGASDVWATHFRDAGIVSIADLADAEQDIILDMCEEHDSLLPLELHTKVLLLIRDFAPVVPLKFSQLPLDTLLLKKQREIRTLFENKISGPEVANLKAMASVVYLVIDKRLTDTLTLELFCSRLGSRQ